ncbi:MAG: hypothetical protein J0I48_10055 [Devosia sp.]|uniref:hypothetical protein n=1 Tax=Devosia sp. 66-22 TaxID=1895753 RepID=UPI00092B830E|nr:hypothetical protein [Devosia sp. 66-22]MBN9346525.1 hypothetical protein [Devosia sp.]OJX53542.1 MAG: hypothetical protein BGO81_01330 [Devosia sp. 66-22]
MSAHTIFERAPFGAIVAWTDGAPRPPERHSRKLDAWKTNNSQGRLIRKQGRSDIGMLDPHASFTLHEADYGADGIIAIRVHRTFGLNTRLTSTIVERPAAGSVRVFARAGHDAELVHLAPHRADAEQWLSEHGYPSAVLEEVSADEAATHAAEGRATA